MNVEEILNKGLSREYKVTLASADLDARLNAILTEFRATARINGFRPGKAPLSLLKNMHGERAKGQVLNEAIQASLDSLFEEKSIKPAMQPAVDLVDEAEWDYGKDLAFTVKLDTLPEIDVASFKAPALERWVAGVEDTAVEERMTEMAARQKSFTKAAKTYKSKDGDAVLIDFVGSVDGVEFEGGKGEDFQLELGSNQFIPGFEDQLVGVKEGEEKDVAVTFPADYQSEDLKGKEAVFKVVVKEVRKPSETKVDAEFAKGMGFEDMDGLKEAIKSSLEQETASLTRAKLKRSLLDILAEEHSFEVPEKMVDMEFGAIWEQIKRDSVMSGEAKEEDFAGMDKPADEAEAKEFRDIAERRVRLGLLLSEIGVANNVTVTNDEINRRVFEEARRFPGQEQQIFEFYSKNEQAKAQLRAPIFEEKVVDFILESADLTDKTVSLEELNAAVQAIEEEEEAPKAKKKPAAKKKAAAKKPAAKKAAAKKPAEKKAAAKKPAAKKPAAKKKAAAKK